MRIINIGLRFLAFREYGEIINWVIRRLFRKDNFIAKRSCILARIYVIANANKKSADLNPHFFLNTHKPALIF